MSDQKATEREWQRCCDSCCHAPSVANSANQWLSACFRCQHNTQELTDLWCGTACHTAALDWRCQSQRNGPGTNPPFIVCCRCTLSSRDSIPFRLSVRRLRHARSTASSLCACHSDKHWVPLRPLIAGQLLHSSQLKSTVGKVVQGPELAASLRKGAQSRVLLACHQRNAMSGRAAGREWRLCRRGSLPTRCRLCSTSARMRPYVSCTMRRPVRAPSATAKRS